MARHHLSIFFRLHRISFPYPGDTAHNTTTDWSKRATTIVEEWKQQNQARIANREDIEPVIVFYTDLKPVEFTTVSPAVFLVAFDSNTVQADAWNTIQTQAIQGFVNEALLFHHPAEDHARQGLQSLHYFFFTSVDPNLDAQKMYNILNGILEAI